MNNNILVTSFLICLTLRYSSCSIIRRSVQGRASARDATKWMNLPDGDNWNIPYVMEGVNINAQVAIRYAINDFHETTCLRFIPRTTEKYFVKFVDDRGCYAQIGRRVDKPNTLSVSEGCEHKGIVLHELMHTIGFYHEQARPDRDDYISIVKENIMEYQEHNFKKLDESKVESFGIPYDVLSIMHYPSGAFSSNGKDTIQGVNGEKLTGMQQENLSSSDIEQVNRMYNCQNLMTNATWESTNSSSTDTSVLGNTADNCKDKHSKCGVFAQRGRCKRRRNWMSTNCPKACGTC
ncbi:hatching enzyme 1.2-like [Styela clava]